MIEVKGYPNACVIVDDETGETVVIRGPEDAEKLIESLDRFISIACRSYVRTIISRVERLK